MSQELKVNTKTKINNLIDAQRALQNLQKNFNLLVDKVISPAEKELKETEGQTGDIQISRNKDKTYTFEVRTEEGWKTPVLGDSVIHFKEKPKTFAKEQDKAIDEIIVDDLSTGGNIAQKTIFDEKNSKFIMPRADYDSGWFQVARDKIYVTGATDGVVPDDSILYYSAGNVVGIPALGFELKDYPVMTQVMYSPDGTTDFAQVFDGKTGGVGTDAILALTSDGAGQYYFRHNDGNDSATGLKIFITSKEHIALSTGEDFAFRWTQHGGLNLNAGSSDVSAWVDSIQASTSTLSCRFKLWK